MEWENDPPVAVQDWQSDPPVESWQGDPVTEPKAKSAKYLSMQAEQAKLREEDSGSTTVQLIEDAQNVVRGFVEAPAKAVGSILKLPENIHQSLGVPTATHAETVIPVEKAKEVVEFVSPGGKASEGSVGQAVQEFAAETISALGTPENLALMMVAPKAPVPVGRYFQGHMLSQVPASAAQIVEGESGKEKTKAALATVAGIALPALIEKGIRVPAKEVIVERAKDVGPVTEAAVRAVERSEPEGGIKTAPVVEKPVLEPTVKDLEAVKEPVSSTAAPQPTVAPATTTGEIVKPAAVESPAVAEPSLPISTSRVEIPQPEAVKPIGMGGAVPSEFELSPKTATGIKNATVDQERIKRGLPPAMETGRRTYGEVWDRAMAKIDQDPSYPDRLISELGDKPRALTDLEDATLLHRQIDLQNEYGKATRELAQAFDDGRLEDVELAKAKVASLSDTLLDVYNINKAVGTETARGLAARRMMAYEDFSLAKMELEKRAAKGGEPLTDTERAQMATLQRKITETQKAYDEYIAKTEQKISALEVKNALTAATQKAQANVNPKIMEVAKRIVGNLHKEADAARQRIKARGLTFGSGPLHEIPNIRDFAIIGADHLVTAGVDFAKWSGKMVREFGDGIKPHLEKIFDESNALLNTIDEKSPFVQELKRRRPVDKQGAKLSYEAAKAKAEWHDQLVKERMARRETAEKLLGYAGEFVRGSRALKTSYDLSAVFRQGNFIVVGNPLRGIKALPDMFRALRSEEAQHRVNLEIQSRPNYPLYLQSKLYLAEHGRNLSKMEEAYMSSWAEKIPGVAASGRAYSTFLNKLRADSFDALHRSMARGKTVTPYEAEVISNFINVATGRGKLPGKWEGAGVALNTAFFAPRYVASRFQLVLGQPLLRGTARTRLVIAKEYAKYLAGLAVIYGLGRMAGADIELDPRSSDFGKMRFGNTRLDPMGGLQQGTVLMSRLGSGETKTIKGKVLPIRGEKVPYGVDDSFDVGMNFLRTKVSPVFGTTIDQITGENVVHEKVTPKDIPESLLAPIAFEDIYDAMIEQGIPKGTALALLSILGMNVQTYEVR